MTFIILSHWKRGVAHRIIYCAKMQIQIPHREPWPLFFSFILPHPSVASPVPSLVLPGPAVILLSLVSYSLSSFVIWPLPSFPSVLFVICWSNAYLYFTINFVVSRVLRHSLSLNPLQNSSPFILPDSRVFLPRHCYASSGILNIAMFYLRRNHVSK